MGHSEVEKYWSRSQRKYIQEKKDSNILVALLLFYLCRSGEDENINKYVAYQDRLKNTKQ